MPASLGSARQTGPASKQASKQARQVRPHSQASQPAGHVHLANWFRIDSRLLVVSVFARFGLLFFFVAVSRRHAAECRVFARTVFSHVRAIIIGV